MNQMRINIVPKRIFTNRKFIGAAVICLLLVAADTLHGQTDIVYVREKDRTSQVKGKITATSPDNVSVKTRSGNEDVAISRITKIKFAGEPSQLDRARSSFKSGRYDDCLKELKKITKAPATPAIKSEMEFFEVFANAQKALRGDNDVTAKQAGSSINTFVKNNPDSYHYYAASETLGKLFLAVGKLELAEREFEKLTNSKSPDMKMRGAFQSGNVQLMNNNFSAAKANFQTIAGMSGSSDEAKEFKLLAQCQSAKADAHSGNPGDAIKTLEKIIATNSSDNERLFAFAYNALGQCYLKSDRLKPASRAFLRTHLLFAGDAESHSEALYNLATIWPKLNQNDRANEMRQTLKSRYRNSYWASKL